MIVQVRTERSQRPSGGAVRPGRLLGRVLLICLASLFTFFLTANSYAEQPQKKAKAKTTKHVKKARTKAAPPEVRMELEPKAMEVLKAACDRLVAARTMRFTAVVTYESPSRLGPPLAYTTKSEVTMQRPDKLRVITPGDGPASDFYYDGKTMVAYVPGEKLAAIAGAPPTIDAALKQAFDSAAIYFPFADVIVADPYKDITDGLKLAFYIGRSSVVGGTTTDMIAYVNDEVFVQAWIGAEDKLPRMLRAVFRADPLRLRHQMELLNWQLDVAVSADDFMLGNVGSVMQIPFARPDVPPPGLQAPAQPQAKPYAKPKAKPTGK